MCHTPLGVLYKVARFLTLTNHAIIMYTSKSKAVKSRCAALNDTSNLPAILAAANDFEVVPMPPTRRDALELSGDGRSERTLYSTTDESPIARWGLLDLWLWHHCV